MRRVNIVYDKVKFFLNSLKHNGLEFYEEKFIDFSKYKKNINPEQFQQEIRNK